MKRRHFMKATAAGIAGLSFVGPLSLASAKTKKVETKNPSENAKWRTAEINIQISAPSEKSSDIWLPVPLAQTSYQELISTNWIGNFSKAGMIKDKTYGAPIFHAQWSKAEKLDLNVIYQVKLRNRIGGDAGLKEETPLYLLPTEHIPTDGIVVETAMKIIKSEKDSDKKAKLIYNWVAENTLRDPKVRGCGLGDVKTLLVSGNLSGKCADLNSLFVGLCRAAGVPAREMFGLRVLSSDISKSIGKLGDVSKAQHCRAEYYSFNSNAWIPVDPADVRKVILEENLNLTDPRVTTIRQKLFGFWEMNWVAYNTARDFSLPPTYTEKINYLMYPQLISGSTQKDGMEPDNFNYTITSKEIV